MMLRKHETVRSAWYAEVHIRGVVRSVSGAHFGVKWVGEVCPGPKAEEEEEPFKQDSYLKHGVIVSML